ncbi:unnamed protein product, partial [Nesidiocoris tenuis]
MSRPVVQRGFDTAAETLREGRRRRRRHDMAAVVQLVLNLVLFHRRAGRLPDFLNQGDFLVEIRLTQ